MRRTLASLTLLVVSALVPAVAAAQEQAEAAIVETSPQWRVDVTLPGVGVGATTAGPGSALALSAGVTAMERSGHGLRVMVGYLDTEPGIEIGNWGAQVNEFFLDASYAHRFRLVGNDRLGVGLDVSGGLSFANVEFAQPHRTCWWSCAGVSTDSPHVDESVADGMHFGGNVGASLDLRASGFLLGIDVNAHVLSALERNEPGEQAFQADVSASLHLGFGFY